MMSSMLARVGFEPEELVLRLARLVSLALRAEPALIRRARLDLLGEPDPAVEADLWFHPAVQNASAEGLVFAPDVADELRRELAAESAERYERAWALVDEHHAGLSPALRLEEEVLYLVHSQRPEARERIRHLLKSALAALVSADRRGLAQWAARALPRFPAEVRRLEEAEMLHAAADLRLGDRLVASGGKIAAGDWMSWIAPTARAELGVTLKRGTLEVTTPTAQTGLVGRATHTLPVLATDPLVLDVLADDDRDTLLERVELSPGESVGVSIPGDAIRLRTLLREEFRLEAEKRVWQREILDFSGVFARHDPVYETSFEQNVAERLAEYSTEESGGYVLVPGPSGAGKTALLTYLARAFASSGTELVPHHFFRREIPEWVDLERVERSLVAQVERLLPELPTEPLRTFGGALGRWSETRTQQELLVVLDGLDQFDEPELLESLLPDKLPPGVKIVAAARPDSAAEGWLSRRGHFLGLLKPPPITAELLELWRQAKGVEGYDLEFVTWDRWWSLELLRSAWEHFPDQVASVEPKDKPGIAHVLHDVVLRQADEVLQRFWAMVCMAREAVPVDLVQDVLPLEGAEILAEKHTVDGGEVWIPRSAEIAALVPIQLPSARYVQYARHYLKLLRQTLEEDDHDPRSNRTDRFALEHVLHQALELKDWETAEGLIGWDDFLVRFLKTFGVDQLIRELEQGRQKQFAEFRTLVDLLTQHRGRLLRSPEALPALIHNQSREDDLPLWGTREPLALSLLRVHQRGTERSTSSDALAHRSPLLGISWASHGMSWISWSRDGLVLLHEAQTRTRLLQTNSSILDCAVNWGDANDIGYVAVATDDGNLLTATISEETIALEESRQCLPGLRGITTRDAENCFVTYSEDGTLQRRTNEAVLRAFSGHDGAVTAAHQLSGGRLVSGGADGTIRVWDQETGEELQRLDAHRAAVTVLAPGSTHLASAGEDATVRLWDLETFESGPILAGHRLAVTQVGFVGSGSRLVSASLDGTARVWSTETGQEAAVLEHGSPVTGLIFRSGELITTALDGMVRRWPGYENPLSLTIDAHDLPCRGCALGRDQQTFATWDDSGTIRIWELDTGKLLSKVALQLPQPRPLISRPRSWIAFDSNRAFEAHLDQEQTRDLDTIAAPTPFNISRASDSGEMVVWNTEGFGTLRLLNPPDAQRATVASRLVHQIDFHPWPPDVRGNPVAVDSSGTLTISAHGTGIARYVAMDTTYHELHDRQINGCSVLRGDEVLTWSRDATLQVSGKKLEGHRGPILSGTVDQNQQTALSASTDASVRHWDLQTGQLLQVWEEIDPHITTLHLNVDQHVLLAGTFQGDVILLSRTEGFTTRAPAHAKHDDRVRAFEPYPDSAGRRFYSISDDGTIKLWEIVEDRHGRHLLCLETAYADDALLSASAIDDAVAAQDARHDLWIYRYTPPEDPRLRWASKTVALHERPELDSRLVMSLEPTTALEVLERWSDWLQVRPLGRSTKAWVRDDDLDPVSSSS